MGTYDVTLAQYTAFLNAVAKTDTYGLYNQYMGEDYPTVGISQSGSSGNYSYSVTGSAPGAANMPVYNESWLDAARFCNWLQNGQPTSGTEGAGTTETGAYTLNGDTTSGTESRNAGATYFIPNENEWYKAAYYKSGGTNAGYWTYPTQSNTAPGNSLALALSTSNEANYYITGYTDPTNYLTPVGTFTASPGPYGTYDMGGDLFQWNDAIISGSSRGLRGGVWDFSSSDLASSVRTHGKPTLDGGNIGLRVASSESVPEPGSLALLLASAAALPAFAWRRRTHAT
jgi:formylglycine-generating enzyme required for sulfatase activity